MNNRTMQTGPNGSVCTFCLAITIISAFVGILLFVNDHAFMLRGLEAELTWFFISLPALAVAIIHFVILFVQMTKKVRLLEKQN